MFKTILGAAAGLSLLAAPAFAQEITSIVVDDTPDNVTFAVESAILDRGLTIDFTSYTGDMLERTREDVGSDVVLFEEAMLFNFCSATVSREVLEADVTNLAFCPYTIFVYSTPDNPGQTIVGHQTYPGESMKPANDLLDAIIADALDD